MEMLPKIVKDKTMSTKRLPVIYLFFACFSVFCFFPPADIAGKDDDDEALVQAMHSISSHVLLDYVKKLASEKFAGRLTGTEEYKASAEWVSSLFHKWAISPGGDNGSYLQAFPSPYTIVFEGGELSSRQPGRRARKRYRYEKDYYPGSQSGSGRVTAEVVYVGYGIRAPVNLRRSFLFIAFGAEEQGLLGSKAYLKDPVVPLEKTVALINLDLVGCGNEIRALAAANYPKLWRFFKEANEKYVHREMTSRYFANLGRPRLDAVLFLRKGVPTISFSVSGGAIYPHSTKDTPDTLTPEIMEDLARILFLGLTDMANKKSLNFRK